MRGRANNIHPELRRQFGLGNLHPAAIPQALLPARLQQHGFFPAPAAPAAQDMPETQHIADKQLQR